MVEARWVASGEWGELVRHLEALLRLKSFPIAIKFVKSVQELEENRWVRRTSYTMNFCQLITIVRNSDWTVGVTKDSVNPRCASILGLIEVPENIRDGSMRSTVWCKTKEDAKKCEDVIPKIPLGQHEALIMAPLVYNPFEPDMILIYGNPAQMILIINAIQFEDYERLEFHCVGESSCSDAIAQCYITGKPSLTIPCYGERRYGHTQDDELVIALPPRVLSKVVRNLGELYKRGIRYPISYYGAESNASEALARAYPGFY